MRYQPDPCVTHVADWISRQGRALEADYAQAARFLRALDPLAAGFSFRTFSDTPYTRRPGCDPLERAVHDELEACWNALIELNHRGAAVSVTINRTNGRGREIGDIEQVRALFLDDDRPPGRMDRFPLLPHIQVQTSAGHYHHYWRVKDLPLSSFAVLQRRLAERYGGDHKVTALNQSMQLPGLWRRKRQSNPSLPVIIKINKIEEYPKDEIENILARSTVIS
ncbi:MAG: DNA-primase RepB domain-containing protein [Gammaproteobacteria bacterium]|nr:DNA-primase RepB domain-containing protein [Gammaproteobacteria bacterium]